ncbi:MAG: DNA polymerase I [Pseudomonadota bacterium]
MSKKKLYLIDGANYIFRAYYAIGSLSTSKGFPTNALYGFTQMILKLKNELKPDYLAVIFDTAEPTFRDELYEKYKANRKEPPDDLAQQFPHFNPILEALNIPILEKPGFEADDLIGTIAKKLAGSDLEVVIVSGDKDLMQLVNDNVVIYDSMKDLQIGEKQVEQRFGVKPAQVIDVLALAGDSSDNIPGVPGIGPKTASKLIQEFGSLEDLLKNLAKLSPNIAQKIAENNDLLKLCQKLVTIDTQVPIEFDLAQFQPGQPDEKKLREIFTEFEFTKLLSALTPQTMINHEQYGLINSEQELESWVNKLKQANYFCFDLETTSLDVRQAEIVGIALAVGKGEAAYIPVGHKGGQVAGADLLDQVEGKIGQLTWPQVQKKLQPILEDPKLKKTGQNLKYDTAILNYQGIKVKGIYFDTMIASYVLNPGSRHNLDALSEKYLGHTKISYDELVKQGNKKLNFAQVDIEKARVYAGEDADVAWQLTEIFQKELKQQGLADLFFSLEIPLLQVLLDMELAGIKVDLDGLQKLSAEFQVKLLELEKKIFELAGQEFNINSPKQLGQILFEKLELATGKKTKTGFSTAVEVLEELAQNHKLPALILEYRSLSKLKSTYADALLKMPDPETGRIHTSFNQTVAATGRLSSSDPNLQNIPIRTPEGRKIRQAFIADEGKLLLSADYSQIELRVLAHLAQDEALLAAFNKGEDVHSFTAAGIFGISQDQVSKEQRAVGKTVNFATLYGQGAFGLSKQLDIEVGEAQAYIDAYFCRYPAVEKYRTVILEQARQDGFVTTLYGRRRYVPDINSLNAAIKQAAERAAFNTVFQGTAADIIKKAMLEIHKHLPEKFPDAKMLLQVHDELLFEVREKQASGLADFVKVIMENIAQLKVPLIVDVGMGKNWLEAH